MHPKVLAVATLCNLAAPPSLPCASLQYRRRYFSKYTRLPTAPFIVRVQVHRAADRCFRVVGCSTSNTTLHAPRIYTASRQHNDPTLTGSYYHLSHHKTAALNLEYYKPKRGVGRLANNSFRPMLSQSVVLRTSSAVSHRLAGGRAD